MTERNKKISTIVLFYYLIILKIHFFLTCLQ